MEIKELNIEEYKNKHYQIDYLSNGYYDIIRINDTFEIKLINSKPKYLLLEDDIASDWLDSPVLFGAFDGDLLVGFVEGYLEKWNNRFTITNIVVLNEAYRNRGVGKMLLNRIIIEAKKHNARMAVLEVVSNNTTAIDFYKRNGFDIIGFDLYSFTNNDPEYKNIRLFMGLKLQ